MRGLLEGRPGRPFEAMGGRRAPTCSCGYPGPQTMPKYRINKTTHNRVDTPGPKLCPNIASIKQREARTEDEIGSRNCVFFFSFFIVFFLVSFSFSFLVSIGFECLKWATPYDPTRDRCQYQLWRPVQRKVLIPALFLCGFSFFWLA
jgi:hypothetical protein